MKKAQVIITVIVLAWIVLIGIMVFKNDTLVVPVDPGIVETGTRAVDPCVESPWLDGCRKG